MQTSATHKQGWVHPTDGDISRCPVMSLFSTSKAKAPKKRSFLFFNSFKTGKKAPGPKGEPVLGSTREFMKNPLSFLSKLPGLYGDVAHFKLNFRDYYLLSNPEHIKNFFVRDYAQFDKSTMWVKVRQVIGSGLLTCPLFDHKRQRRIVQPAFTESSLTGYAALMPEIVSRHIASWSDNRRIDVTADMDSLTLKIAARTLLGEDISDEEQGLEDMINRFNGHFTPFKMFLSSILPDWVIFRAMGFMRIRKYFQGLSERIIKSGLATGFSDKNVLSLLAQSHLNEGGRIEDATEDLTSQIINMLLAGQETVATSLNWILYALANNPRIEKELHEEIDRVFGGDEPTYDKLSELTETEKIIKESMRLFPAGWVIAREALKDCDIGGVTIPQGSIVTVSPYVTQRDSRFFDQPLAFNPNRWDTEEEAKRPEFSYFPFGGGARRCIGSGYVMMELKFILAGIAQRGRFAMEPGQKVEFDPLITLRPKRHLWMRFMTRRVDKKTTSPQPEVR